MKGRCKVWNVLGLALLLLLAGCGRGEEASYDELAAVDIKTGTEGQEKEGGNGNGTGNGDFGGAGADDGLSWQDTHVFAGCCFESAVVRDGVIYGYYIEKNGAVVISLDAHSGEKQSETLLPGATELGNITADAQGNIYVAGTEAFQKISASGEVTVFDDFALEDLEERDFPEPKGIYVDSQGRFYFQYGVTLPANLFYEEEPNVYTAADRIYVRDSQLNPLFYVQMHSSRGNRFLSFSFDEKEQPVILAEDEEGMYTCGIDFEKQGLTEKRELGSLELGDFSETAQIAFAEDGFVYCAGNDLYRYDYGKTVPEKLLNLSSCGILASDILYLGVDGETIEIIDHYDNPGAGTLPEGTSMGGGVSGDASAAGQAGSGKASEYVAVAKGQNTKARLTLGVVMASAELERAVANYNRFSEKGKVALYDYFEDGQEDFEKALERLKLDVVSGKGPDIMEVSMINTDALIDKGIFADLYGFMDADPAFDRDMLLDAVRKSCEQEGHLYSCGSAFQLHTMWGSQELIQGKYGIGMDELQQMLESRGKNINAIYGFSADEPVLTTLCTFALDELIDWEKGTCDFSGTYMQGMLDLVLGWSGYGDWSMMQGIRNGEILLTVGRIGSVADYQLEKEFYGGEISFVGYPSTKGTGTAMGFRSQEFAVNAKGTQQEIAWDFVKYYMQNGYDGQGFPTLKANFEAVMERAMEDAYEDTMEGTYKVPKGTYYSSQDGYMEVYAASQAEVDAVKALIGRAESRYKYNTNIQNIITEEAEGYLQGQKDFQAVADIINSRVGIYLGEQ